MTRRIGFSPTPNFYDRSYGSLGIFARNATAAHRISTLDHFVHSSTYGPDSDVVCHVEIPDTDWLEDLESVCTLPS